jgi:hypothetical protein
MPDSFTWVDGTGGGTPVDAANLNKEALIADIGTAGTRTGDALRAAYASVDSVELLIPSSATSGDASATFASTISQAASRGIRNVRVPQGSYAVKSVYLNQDDVRLVCEPGVVFTWAGAQTSGGSCFIIGRAGDTVGVVANSGIVGGPFTFDFTGQAAGNQIRGITITNAVDFEIGDARGRSIPDQCVLYFARNGTGQGPQRGQVASVYAYNAAQGYGAIQLSAGSDIEFGTLYADTAGVPFRVETDGYGAGDATDIRVRKVISKNAAQAISLSAHAQNIKRITVDHMVMTGCTTHESVFEPSTEGGSISDVQILGGVVEDCTVGAGQAIIGPNDGDPIATGIKIHDVVMRRVTGTGFSVQGYTLINCSVEGATGYGFTDSAPSGLTGDMVATLVNCKATRCATGSVSGSKAGFWFSHHTVVRMMAPVAYDDTGATVSATLTVPNGTFDTDATGWTAGSCTIAQTTTVKRSGTGSLQVTTSSTSSPVVRTNIGTAAIPVTANDFYTAQAWYLSAADGLDGRMQVEWFDASGASLGQVYGPIVPFDASIWQPIAGTFQAPATAAFVTVRLLVWSPPGAGRIYYLDDVTLWQTVGLPQQAYGVAVGGTTKAVLAGARLNGNGNGRTQAAVATATIAETAPAEPTPTSLGARTTGAAPAAGSGSALPATPAGYVSVIVAGTERKVAYY